MEKTIKLNLGSGDNIYIIPELKKLGWDNIDFNNSTGVLGLIISDLIKPLNYDGESVDYIYHSNMLEHFNETDGFNFLKECYRILKKGGVMRVVMPDMDKFVLIYQNWDTTDINYYLYSIIQCCKESYITKVRFFNYFSISEVLPKYGHRFYYNIDDLAEKCYKIGFEKVKHFRGNAYDKTDYKVFEFMDTYYRNMNRPNMYVEIKK